MIGGLALAALLLSQAGEPVFRLLDSEITESSALAVSRTFPDLAYTVDDSGDSARVFVVEIETGRTVGVTELAGVENDDFEALAFAPGGRLIVGDIGDNAGERQSVELHVIDEPGRGDRTAQPRTVRLSYPDSPVDAEAVLVRDGRVFVVSKVPFRGSVFRGPSMAALPDSAQLERVADAPGLVTDATVLGDGLVLLRSYTEGFVMTTDWEVAETFDLPPAELGESLAAPPQGSFVYAGSEGERAAVYRVDVPSGTPTPAPEPTASPEGQATPPRASGQDDAAGGEPTADGGWLPWLGGGLLLGVGLVTVGVGAIVIRARR